MAKRMFLLLLTLIGVGCGNNPTTPTVPSVPPPAPTAPEPQNVTLTFTMAWAENGVPTVAGVTVTCLEGCSDGQIQTTDNSGRVTFEDTYPPLVIEAQKSGYITRQVDGLRYDTQVTLSHVWPDELEEAIDHLGFTELIASGEILLRWGEDERLEREKPGVAGTYDCPTIVVGKHENRDYMISVLVHEAVHAWQGLKSVDPPCNVDPGFVESEEGKAWKEAWDKDIEEHGPYPDIDEFIWNGENYASRLWENQAFAYSDWYFGRPWQANREERLRELYRLAPNRCKYFEDRFGPPPSRR